MIWESSYWKEDILRQADALKKKTKQIRWTDRSYAQLEKTVMLGFYSIRKLLEAKKLTVGVIKTKLPVIFFPSLGEAVTLLNWHRFERFYNFDTPNEQTRSLQWFCNIFVHSYIFSPAFIERGSLDGIFFNSDHIRNEALFYVHIQDVINLFETVGNDSAAYAEKYSLNKEKGDFEVVLRNTPDKD